MMIGIYDYTVVLTYLSLCCSVFGITRAIEKDFTLAVLCLALSGLMDMFDGKIARTKKGRSDDEKLFGIQIDSLCDVVCFGVFPAVIVYNTAAPNIFTYLIICYYCICSVIRLAYFNVLETNRQRVETGSNKYYRGLPITSIAIIMPAVYLIRLLAPGMVFEVILYIAVAAVGTLFITDFKLKKPDNKKLVLLVSVTGCILIAFLVLSHCRGLSTGSIGITAIYGGK